MIKGFDLVVDIQICMMIVIFVLSIRYALAEERTLTSYSIMPALYSVWSGILLYYFSHFFFLASLWFLLGVFLTVGMVVFFRRSILYRFCQRNRKLEYYPRTSFLLPLSAGAFKERHFCIRTSWICGSAMKRLASYRDL